MDLIGPSNTQRTFLLIGNAIASTLYSMGSGTLHVLSRPLVLLIESSDDRFKYLNRYNHRPEIHPFGTGQD